MNTILNFHIHYIAPAGQVLAVAGAFSKSGETQTWILQPSGQGFWNLRKDIEGTGLFEYRYLVLEGDSVRRSEWGEPHQVCLSDEVKEIDLNDYWQPEPEQELFYRSAFTDSLLKVSHPENSLSYRKNHVVIKVSAPFVRKGYRVGISGDIALFGQWKPEKPLLMHSHRFPEWSAELNANDLPVCSNYKFVLVNESTGRIYSWESGEPRILITPQGLEQRLVVVSGMSFQYQEAPWKGAGVAIPVFSLRSDSSWGCGDFGDLRKMIDWAVATGLQMVQLLPVNDTTLTETWKDSYPYHAISNEALHPMYLSLSDLPALDNKELGVKLEQERLALNALSQIDYEKVLKLKWKYIRELFKQQGNEVLSSSVFGQFMEENRYWLIPYSAFSHLRALHKDANFENWGEFASYDQGKIDELCSPSYRKHDELRINWFVQFLLHTQLLNARNHAHAHSVVLKGDIPIGICRHSVETWTEPYLFNSGMQVGAPPDVFSVKGQNWGFPSYRWDRMLADGFNWWKRRFQHMAAYFDAYRIDHILGFFRIWEIPVEAVEGLLGHFHPALPYTAQELKEMHLEFDEATMIHPYFPSEKVIELFGKEAKTIQETYLEPAGSDWFRMKPDFATQDLVRRHFGEKCTKKEAALRDKLYELQREVLFVSDPYEPNHFHPGIGGLNTAHFQRLDVARKERYRHLFNDFFYVRHEQFWREKALEKLPALVASSRMLACGEDLGMIPACVPQVMRDLNILSLEIQRMPKAQGQLFENLNHLPYQSVCTTSTHDMNPLRAWWLEDHSVAQQYYNQMLWKAGEAPWECTPELCKIIVQNHLSAPSMWVILPWQDWMACDAKLRNPDPLSERINEPGNPRHYWRYRMHLSLEQLLKEKVFNNKIRDWVIRSGRY